MNQFYKIRDFGMLVSDTFAFFKEHGKNYFKNYFLLNGILIIALVALIVFGYREIFSQYFNGNTSGQSYYFETYFQENQLMLIMLLIAFFIVFLVMMVVNYSYPILYMKRLSETGDKNITSDMILADFKSNISRIFYMLIGMVFVVTPLSFIVIGISYALIFIIIGFFVLLTVTPAIMNVVSFLLFDYYHTKKGFFESLSYALRSQFSYSNSNIKPPFWKYWGSTVVMYLIIQVINTVFTMIPLVILIFKKLALEESGATPVESNPFAGETGVYFIITYAVSIFFSIILSNLLYVNAGFLYYDSRTDLHQKENFNEIDSIGNAH